MAFGFIIAIVFIKYKPVYAVSISGEEVGYVQSEDEFNKIVEENIINYDSKNVDSVTLDSNPEYELKLVNKTEETNEDSVLIALQKEMNITYKYYEILLDGQKLESVDTKEDAENLITTLKSENQELNLEVAEKITTNISEIQTNSLEVAKANITGEVEEIIEKQEEANSIAVINGVKIATIPVTGTISSRYGVSSRIRSSNHTGLDIAAKKGTPIKVIADGVVESAGWSGSYGYLVKVNHGNNVESWYAHTSKMYVSAGDTVSAGDVIAAVGSTGNSTGPHLHLEIRINGEHINPQKYLYN